MAGVKSCCPSFSSGSSSSSSSRCLSVLAHTDTAAQNAAAHKLRQSDFPEWKPSASVMVVAPRLDGGVDAAGCDYQVLFVRRSLTSRAMPGAYVFPGGALKRSCVSVACVLQLY